MSIHHQISDIAKETIEVLKKFDTQFISKIPSICIDELRKLAEKSDKNVIIYLNKKLYEQEISEEAKDLVSMLYYSFVANDQDKEYITKMWKENS